MMKRTLGIGLTCAFLLTSCGAPAVDTSLSSDTVLSNARSTFVAETTAAIEKKSEGTGTLSLKGDIDAMAIAGAKGTIAMDATTMINNKDDDQQVSADMTLNIALTESPVGAATGKLAANLVGTAKDIYLKVSELSVDIANEQIKAQIEAMLTQTKPYIGDWYQLSQEALQEQGGSAVTLQTFTLADLKMLMETYKDTQVFDVKETLPTENGMYVYKVGLRSEGVITLLEKFFEISKAPVDISTEEKANIAEAIAAINNSPMEMMVYVDAKNMRFSKLSIKGVMTEGSSSFDIAFEASSSSTDKADLSFTVKGMNDGAELVNVAIMGKMNNNKNTGTMTLKTVDGPSLDLSFEGSFEKKSVTIETPENAIDLTTLLGGLTTPAVQDETTTTLPVEQVEVEVVGE